jgi:hypothetical protein
MTSPAAIIAALRGARGYAVVGAYGYGNAMGGYNYNNNGFNNAGMNGGWAGNTADNGPNIFSGANLRQRAPQQPAPAANVAAPAAPADPPAEMPSRDWTIVNDETGDKTIQAQYTGLLDHKVVLRKPDGHITLVAIDQLSVADQDYVAAQTGHKAG